MNSISIFGGGKLGLPLAASFASQDFSVLTVDINPQVVNAINKKKAHIYEPGLNELLQSNSNLEATTDIERAITETDTTFILVPTPSERDGSFSLKYVLQVCESLGKHLKGQNNYHLIVISSTVMPTSCNGEIREALERVSGRVVGKDLGLCYCPEFVALGNAIKGFQEPDFVMIGQSDDKAGTKLQAIYERFCINNPPIVRTNLVNAEIAKIALNFYLTCKINVANTLAEICENVQGANVDEVTGAIGLDTRIGKKYLKGGLAAGGTCLPRDIRAMWCLASKTYSNQELPKAINLVNNWQTTRLYALVVRAMKDKKNLGILGLAFKPDTDVVEESPGWELWQKASSKKWKIACYDKVVKCEYSVDTAQECVDKSDVVVLTLPIDYDIKFREDQTVIDCWRMIDKDDVSGKYIAIGVGK